MATLGKCLLFCLKYHAEMEQLYDMEKPKIHGLPNAEQVLKKIQLVGDTASREAAEFLETCVPGIEQHFRAIGAIERVRRNPEVTWDLHFRVAPGRVKDRRFYVGVCFDFTDQPALVPWVWSHGGRSAADDVIAFWAEARKGA